jgi:hypothetical protein
MAEDMVSRSRISPIRITSGPGAARSSGGLQRLGVAADLALVDHRLLVAKQVFDRVFDGQDVAR